MGFPGGATAKRIVVEGVGWLLVVAGIAALILPGPGLLMLFAGLAILSQQYEWAEKRVRPVERAAMRAAAESVSTPVRIAMSTLGAAALLALGVLWLVHPDAPAWWPLRDSWWLPGAPVAGITLELSGLIAFGLVVYSYWKFRIRGDAKPQRAAGE